MPGKEKKVRKERKRGEGKGKVSREKGGKFAGEKDRVLSGNLDKARAIAQLEGARGVDPRASGLAPASALGNLALQQLDHSVDVVGELPVKSVAMLALGPVLSAIKRGWLSAKTFVGVSGATVAYNAWVYLTQAFLQCSQGTYPTIQSAPEWFWQICDALRPKVVPFKTADVSYKTKLIGGGTDYIPSSLIDYGSTPSQLVFGSPDTSNLVDGMPTLTPCAYNATTALESVQSMFDYFPESLMCKRSGGAAVPYLLKDASAFAGVWSELGFDSSSVGGIATSLTNEAHINSPILSKLCSYNDTRGYIEERRSAGSAVYTIPRIMEFTDYKQLHNKAPPIFKFYNFDRFFEILALSLGRAMQIGTNAGTLGDFPVVCPLTSLQVQILLRQAMLPIFSNELGQDLVSSDGITLVPLSTLSNGYAPAGSDMLLPSFLVEAIRACARKVVQVTKKYKNYQLDIVPLLCRSPDIFQLGNYGWGPSQVVFTEDTDEIPVDIIDMSAMLPALGKVYCLPACAVVDEWREDWNQYIHDIESALAGVSSVGTERGISCLSTVFFSDFTTPNAVGQFQANGPAPTQGKGHLRKQESKKQVKEYGTPRKMKVKSTPTPLPGSDVYSTIGMVCTSTVIAENGMEWKYQRVMPHAYFQAPGGGAGDFFVTKRQVFNHEGYKIAHSTQGIDDTGTPYDTSLWSQTVFNLDLAASAYCVRGQLSTESEVERDLRALGEMGRGGFLTSIAGMLAEDVFGIKGAKTIAGKIADATGL